MDRHESNRSETGETADNDWGKLGGLEMGPYSDEERAEAKKWIAEMRQAMGHEAIKAAESTSSERKDDREYHGYTDEERAEAKEWMADMRQAMGHEAIKAAESTSSEQNDNREYHGYTESDFYKHKAQMAEWNREQEKKHAAIREEQAKKAAEEKRNAEHNKYFISGIVGTSLGNIMDYYKNKQEKAEKPSERAEYGLTINRIESIAIKNGKRKEWLGESGSRERETTADKIAKAEKKAKKRGFAILSSRIDERVLDLKSDAHGIVNGMTQEEKEYGGLLERIDVERSKLTIEECTERLRDLADEQRSEGSKRSKAIIDAEIAEAQKDRDTHNKMLEKFGKLDDYDWGGHDGSIGAQKAYLYALVKLGLSDKSFRGRTKRAMRQMGVKRMPEHWDKEGRTVCTQQLREIAIRAGLADPSEFKR